MGNIYLKYTLRYDKNCIGHTLFVNNSFFQGFIISKINLARQLQFFITFESFTLPNEPRFERSQVIRMNFFYQSRVESFSSFLSNDNTYPAHLHRQTEIMFVLSGELSITVEEQTYELHQGDMSITFPDKIHSLYTPQSSRVLLMVFDIDYLQDFRTAFSEYIPLNPIVHLEELTEHGKSALSWLAALSKNMPATADMPSIEGLPNHPVISDTSKIVAEQNDLSPNLLYTKSYLTILLTDVFSVLQLEKRKTCTDKNICENILIYLDQHFQEDVSLDSTAKALGISKFYLSQILSNKLHTSFPSYVTARRLDYAEKLLTTTVKSVTDVAFESGFTSPRTFFRSFQSAYHVTPHQYRKNHNKFHS